MTKLAYFQFLPHLAKKYSGIFSIVREWFIDNWWALNLIILRDPTIRSWQSLSTFSCWQVGLPKWRKKQDCQNKKVRLPIKKARLPKKKASLPMKRSKIAQNCCRGRRKINWSTSFFIRQIMIFVRPASPALNFFYWARTIKWCITFILQQWF